MDEETKTTGDSPQRDTTESDEMRPSLEAFTDHIPPTDVFDSSSFFIELGHELTPKNNLTGPAARPKIYTADGIAANTKYENIAIVRIATEFEREFSVNKYEFLEADNAQLRLWLLDYPYPASLPAEPNIVIKGNFIQMAGAFPTMLIEIDDHHLKPGKRKHKKREIFNHGHRGNDNENREFRIRKWQLVDARGRVFGDEAADSGAVGYRFKILFYGDIQTH
jgi:hypothetical protein